MGEYIDRQAVLDAIPQTNEDKTISLFGAVADFIVLVNEIPAADVAPVVRCKDCTNHGHCMVEDSFVFARLNDDRRFCGAGRAKMNEEETHDKIRT